jgi:sporulation protein YlmC with PRC-barrel domain
MAIHGNLRDYQFGSDVDDIRGSEIFGANDEKLGTVDDVIFDTRSGELRYLVVNTGGWLSSNKFIVPGREVMNTVEGEDHFRVNLTREQIERLPAYSDEFLEDDERWGDYEQRYASSDPWTDGPVLHREGSTHMLTPEPEELPAGSGEGIKVSNPRPISMDQPRFGATSHSEQWNDPTLGAGPQTEHRQVTNRTQLDPLPPSDHPAIGADPTLEYERPARSEQARSDVEPAPYSRVRRQDTEGNRRFREFQERLRQEREAVLRKLRDRDRAA